MKPVDVAPALAAAASAIEDGRWADAAAQLIEAWRSCRSARIADALARVDLRLPPPAPLEGKTVGAREQHWFALVDAGDDESLRRALAAPWPVHPRGAAERVTRLAWLLSPRISNALLALHRSGKYTSVAGTRLSRTIFHLLVEKDDHAIVAELERFEQNRAEAARLGPAVFRRRRPATPYLSPEGEALLARIEQQLAVDATPNASSRERLLAAIYEAPHDDAPRIVYADVLAEADDPRGEFITLQLARAADGSPPTRREKQLLRDAGTHWFDGLDGDGATKIVHARGFPAAATLASGEPRAAAWSTIEKLVLAPQHAFRGAAHLRGLRELYNLHPQQLPTAQLPSYELDVLAVREYHEGLAGETPFAPRVLGLAWPRPQDRMLDHVRRLPGLPIARRLETVRLGTGLRELVPAYVLATETGYAIELVGSSDLTAGYQWTARITRSELVLHWTGDNTYGDVAFASVVPLLTALGARSIESLRITAVEVAMVDKVRDALVRIVRTWPRLRSAEILGLDASETN